MSFYLDLRSTATKRRPIFTSTWVTQSIASSTFPLQRTETERRIPKKSIKKLIWPVSLVCHSGDNSIVSIVEINYRIILGKKVKDFMVTLQSSKSVIPNRGAADSYNSLIFIPIKPARGAAKYINYSVRVPQTKKGWETLL